MFVILTSENVGFYEAVEPLALDLYSVHNASPVRWIIK